MATIAEMLRRAKSVNRVLIRKMTAEIISEKHQDFEQKQRDQMLLGLDNKGRKIGYYSTQAYSSRKYSMNSKAGYGVVDLKFKGDFQDEITARVVSANRFIMYSQDWKMKKLTDIEKGYGPDIFGFNDTSKKEITSEIVMPALVFKIKNVLLRV